MEISKIQKTLFLILFSACVTLSVAQTEVRSVEAQEQYQLRLSALVKNDIEKAAAAGEKELTLLRQQEGKTDSLQMDLLPRLGRLYFRLKQVDRAIELNQEGIALCQKNQLANSLQIADMYDNLAFYYTSKGLFDKALDNSKKAVAIYLHEMPNNQDMAATLMHAAECCYNVVQYADAILYQEHACRLYAEIMGERSDTYLNELDYLAKYYKAANQTDKAKETEELKNRLEKEQKYGYIPMKADLSTAEKCALHNEDAYFACTYYLRHYIVADSMMYLGKYIFNYVSNSADVHVFSAAAEQKWMSDKNAFAYMVAYFSGFVLYQLDEPEEEISLAAYRTAICSLMVFYENNKKFLGKNAVIAKYMKLAKRNPKRFLAKIEKDYQVYQQVASQGKVRTVKIEEKGDKFVIDPKAQE